MADRKSEPRHQEHIPRLIEWAELRQQVPLSRTTIWRCIRDGKFPPPVSISPGRVAWLETEILDWLSDQKRRR